MGWLSVWELQPILGLAEAPLVLVRVYPVHQSLCPPNTLSYSQGANHVAFEALELCVYGEWGTIVACLCVWVIVLYRSGFKFLSCCILLSDLSN